MRATVAALACAQQGEAHEQAMAGQRFRSRFRVAGPPVLVGVGRCDARDRARHAVPAAAARRCDAELAGRGRLVEQAGPRRPRGSQRRGRPVQCAGAQLVRADAAGRRAFRRAGRDAGRHHRRMEACARRDGREPVPRDVPRHARAGRAGTGAVDRGRVAMAGCVAPRRQRMARDADLRPGPRAPGTLAEAGAGAARLPAARKRLQRADDEGGAARVRGVREASSPNARSPAAS